MREDRHNFLVRYENGESVAEILASSLGVEWLKIFDQHPAFFDKVAGESASELRATLRRAMHDVGGKWNGLFPKVTSYYYSRQPIQDYSRGLEELSFNTLELIRPELAYQISCSRNHDIDLNDTTLVNELNGKELRDEIVSLLDKSTRRTFTARTSRLSCTPSFSVR